MFLVDTAQKLGSAERFSEARKEGLGGGNKRKTMDPEGKGVNHKDI